MCIAAVAGLIHISVRKRRRNFKEDYNTVTKCNSDKTRTSSVSKHGRYLHIVTTTEYKLVALSFEFEDDAADRSKFG